MILYTQVLWGNRGKRGGVIGCDTSKDAGRVAEDLLGISIENEVVEQLLVEKQIEVTKE